MKKFVTILLVAVFVMQLCGCVIDNQEIPDGGQQQQPSEDAQDEPGQPEEDEQTDLPESEDSSDLQTDGDVQTQPDGNSPQGEQTQPEDGSDVDRPQPDGSESGDMEDHEVDTPVDAWTDEQIVQAYFIQRDTWDAHAVLDETTPTDDGQTGYAFFDIDLDGKKELAVQMSGGTMRKGETAFYRLDETGTVVRYEELNDIFSLAVENLVLAEKADGSKMYLMHYTLQPNSTEHWEYWAELLPQEGQRAYREAVRFTKVTVYAEDGSTTYTYYIGNDITDEATYTAAYTDYMADLTLTAPAYQMIAYSDWTVMDDLARTAALLESFRAK